MAGRFRLGQIACCKPNPGGGFGCYTADGSLVYNSQSSVNPSPNTCPETFATGAPPPAPPTGPIGTQPPGPPPGAQCQPGEFWDGTMCRGSVGTIPGDAGLPQIPPGGGGQGTQPPAGNQSALQVSNCNVPPGYEPAPGGGARSPDNVVYACPRPDGTYDVINARSLAPVQSGVSRACLDQYGDVTFEQADSSICGGQPQTGPASGDCALPQDTPIILCPPSNGITVDYYVDALTGSYMPNMTTQPPACASLPNVRRVAANSPYCGGSTVDGPGSDLPSLVACFVSPGASFDESVVNIHNGPDFAPLAQGVLVKDIPTRFPGRRWIMVTGMFCSALPDFGQAAPAPVTAPGPVTIPTTQTPATQPLVTTPGAAPLTYPITNMWFPESLEAPPIQPVGAPLSPPPPYYAPAPPPPPRPAYVPGQPLPVTDWFGICVQRARGL